MLNVCNTCLLSQNIEQQVNKAQRVPAMQVIPEYDLWPQEPATQHLTRISLFLTEEY